MCLIAAGRPTELLLSLCRPQEELTSTSDSTCQIIPDYYFILISRYSFSTSTHKSSSRCVLMLWASSLCGTDTPRTPLSCLTFQGTSAFIGLKQCMAVYRMLSDRTGMNPDCTDAWLRFSFAYLMSFNQITSAWLFLQHHRWCVPEGWCRGERGCTEHLLCGIRSSVWAIFEVCVLTNY